jgi:hypothetical protein
MVSTVNSDWGLFPITARLGDKSIEALLNLRGIPYGYAPQALADKRTGMLLLSAISLPGDNRRLVSFELSKESLTLKGIRSEQILLIATNSCPTDALLDLPYSACDGLVNSVHQSEAGLLCRTSASEVNSGDFTLSVKANSSVIALLKTESAESYSAQRSDPLGIFKAVELYQNELIGTGDKNLVALVFELLKSRAIVSLPPQIDISQWLDRYITQIEMGCRTLNETLWHKRSSSHRGLEILNGGIGKVLAEITLAQDRLLDRLEYVMPVEGKSGNSTKATQVYFEELPEFYYSRTSPSVFADIPDPWL